MNFQQLYDEYSSSIYRLCKGYVNDPIWAQDIVQETFISVWQNLASFKGASSYRTWIFRIAVNNCLKQLKQKKRRQNIEQSSLLEKSQIQIPEKEHPQLEHLFACIATLKELDRIIISMVLEEIPQAEIANILGLSNGNVRTKIHRIKNIISKKMNQHESI